MDDTFCSLIIGLAAGDHVGSSSFRSCRLVYKRNDQLVRISYDRGVLRIRRKLCKLIYDDCMIVVLTMAVASLAYTRLCDFAICRLCFVVN